MMQRRKKVRIVPNCNREKQFYLTLKTHTHQNGYKNLQTQYNNMKMLTIMCNTKGTSAFCLRTSLSLKVGSVAAFKNKINSINIKTSHCSSYKIKVLNMHE